MPDVQDEYQELVLLDLVDDSVVTGPDSPFARAADQPRRGWRTRILGEELDGCLDASTDVRIELAQLPSRGRGQGDLVSHVSTSLM